MKQTKGNEMKSLNEMTIEELNVAKRNYDKGHNEGGEGYNPYADEISRREAAHIKANPTPRTRYDITRDINRVYQSSGNYIDGGAEINALNAELAAFDAAESAKFAAEWTLEVFTARRAEWNAAIAEILKNNGNKVPPREYNALVQRMGYDVEDIKRAKKLHGIA